MRHLYILGVGMIFLVLSACAPQPVPTAEPAAPAEARPVEAGAAPTTFSDPFAYCAALGTIDQPDARYTGPEMPEALAEGLRQASGAPNDAPLDAFVYNSFWRCVNGRVYACSVGANLPCASKANTSQAPTQAESDFCKENPTSDFIPAYITGHDTIYAWACKAGQAVAGQQVFHVDPQGFIQEIWYPIPAQ